MTNKVCATLMACENRDRCTHAPKVQTHGIMHKQFFVPGSVGDRCPHYQPIGSDSEND